MPHLKYGLLLWGVNLKDIFPLKKKAMRLVTHNTYNSHTEPIVKENFYTNYFKLNANKYQYYSYHNLIQDRFILTNHYHVLHNV